PDRRRRSRYATCPFKWLDVTSGEGTEGSCYGNTTVTPLVCSRRGANVPNRYRNVASSGRYTVRLLRASLVIVVLVLATHGNAWAQAVAGAQISGTVRDSSGGTIPGAEVTVTKIDTGATRTVFTSADGVYVLPNLSVG